VIDTNQPPGSIVIENFEAPSYAAIDWTTTGNFVGAAPLTPDAQGRITLQILVDWSSVEVFANGGQVAMTAQIFPAPTSRGVAVFAQGSDALLDSVTIQPVRTIWPH
jgi:sucrose-6-phosphate hydrolase SacC (GH32 family)